MPPVLGLAISIRQLCWLPSKAPSTSTVVHLDARRIHHDVVDTLLDQPVAQPEAVAPPHHSYARPPPGQSRSALSPWRCARAAPPCLLPPPYSGSGRVTRHPAVASSPSPRARRPCTARCFSRPLCLGFSRCIHCDPPFGKTELFELSF